MSRITEKIIAGLLILFLVITVGYQVYISFYGSIKTETIFEYTVSRSIPVDGIAIRSETVIGDKPGGIENCLFEDGTRVTVGENIAEFYKNAQSNLNLRRLRELESEIKMLEEAQDASVNNFSTTDILNRDIKEQLGYLAGISASRRFYTVDAVKKELTSLVNKKQVSTGKVKSYDSRIAALKLEHSGLQAGGSDTQSYATAMAAPVSGFFSSVVDGYEEKLAPDAVENYSVGECLALLSQKPVALPLNKIGKIVTTQNWLFVAACDKSNLEFVQPGQEVAVTFESINKKIPAKISGVLQDKRESRIVLLLKCNQVSGDLLSLRAAQAVISFNQYTGVRVNMPDVRFQGKERGVYVLDNNTVRFKRIDPVYEEQNFVLSRLIPPDARNEEYVNLFDQVITEGNDLSDGKVIQ